MPGKTLILTSRQIKKLLDMRQVLAIAEKVFAYHAQKKTQMPAKIYLHLEKYCGDFRAMPAYIEPLGTCGIKWVNVHPANKKKALPTVMALIILNDPATGCPLAVMDGTYITNMRTGAAGGLAAKYLANRDSSKVGLVGCGVQALFQLMALNELFKIKSISVYDKDPLRTISFIKKIRHLKVNIEKCRNIKDCVSDKDIVVTTTPSRRPIVMAGWISPGTHINAIGADARGKEELEAGILKKAKIVVDDKVQALRSGEINVPIAKRLIRPSDIHATIGEIIIGKKKGRVSKGEITVFDSTGLAIQDIAVADHVYRKFMSSRPARVRIIDFGWKH